MTPNAGRSQPSSESGDVGSSNAFIDSWYEKLGQQVPRPVLDDALNAMFDGGHEARISLYEFLDSDELQASEKAARMWSFYVEWAKVQRALKLLQLDRAEDAQELLDDPLVFQGRVPDLQLQVDSYTLERISFMEVGQF
tara:strand:+ start:78 stop:494 length:417 start_codon:yes stop_codon:yes gene_type:complete